MLINPPRFLLCVFALALVTALFLAPLPGHTASFPGCFSTPAAYMTNYTRELAADENIAGTKIVAPGHLLGTGVEIEANCDCPSNLKTTTDITLLTLAGSPLPAGVSGYGILTDKVDVDVAGYIDAINSPDGGGLEKIQINAYPTAMSQLLWTYDARSTESSESVCSDATRPQGAASQKRKFKWNVITATFYIKKPILGEEVIPPTLVVQNYACLASTNYCDKGDPNTRLVSNISLSGKFSAPLSCTINAGSTIEVDFGNIISKQFVSQGEPPRGYTIKNVDIAYHCDGPAVGNEDKIKLTLTADQGTAEGSDKLIARMLGRDDIGVRVFDNNDANVALDGTFAFPVVLDETGNGVIRIKAAPVSTKNTPPAPGKFEGNVTVKMELR